MTTHKKYRLVIEQHSSWIEKEYPHVSLTDIDFEGAVNFLLSEGWGLAGGVSSVSDGDHGYLIQAVTLETYEGV